MDDLKPIIDSDMDSMFVLPLSLVPLQTPALQKAKLVKNMRLESVVELFSDSKTGAGHVKVDDLPKMFGWTTDETHPDLSVLQYLALIPSYDVYSLRVSLREHGIPVNNFTTLKLSPEKAEELTSYMATFTRPLVQRIYSEESKSLNSYSSIVSAFRTTDVRGVRSRLDKLAAKLNIEIHELPEFLEDYGDIYLSVSYFRSSLDRLKPYFIALTDSLTAIRSHFQMKQNANLMRTCKTIEEVLLFSRASLYGRMDSFDKDIREMWDNISPEKFRKVREMIKRDHVNIGSVLCGLTVKMNSFACAFPQTSVGGPIKRADFLTNEVVQGLELIRHTILRGLGSAPASKR